MLYNMLLSPTLLLFKTFEVYKYSRKPVWTTLKSNLKVSLLSHVAELKLQQCNICNTVRAAAFVIS